MESADEVGRTPEPRRTTDVDQRHAQKQYRAAGFSGQPLLRGLRVAGDSICIAIALYVAFILRFRFGLLSLTEAHAPVTGHHVAASIVWFVSLVGFLTINRLYDEDTLFVGGGEAARVTRSVFEAIAILALFVFLTQTFAISRAWFLFAITLTLSLLFIWRLAFRNIVQQRRRRGSWRRSAVILEGGRGTEEPVELGDDHEFEVIGQITAGELLQNSVSSDRRALPGSGTILLIERGGLAEEDLWRIVIAAGQLGWSTFIQGATRSVSRDRMSVREIGGKTIIKVSPPNLTGMKALEKRVLDLVVSTTLIAILSPVLGAIALTILVTSGRPIFFRQERVGLNGRRFHMIKFRTMHVNAEANGLEWTTRHDQRRTVLGAVLRRFSVDELPQLWNVVGGDMSLVGPRPEVPSHVDRFTQDFPWYAYRHRIRPGMTGWAQSRGFRGDTSIASRIELDNRYIEHWSLTLDLRILLATIREVITGRNAY